MASEIRSDALVERLFDPTMDDAETVYLYSGKRVDFNSIAVYDQDTPVSGSIEAYRRGMRLMEARAAGRIVLNEQDILGVSAAEQTIRQLDTQSGGNPGGIMLMMPLPNRELETGMCSLIPPLMDVDGLGHNSIYRPPTAASMRALAEQALEGTLRQTKGRLKIAQFGTGRTAGGPLLEDMHRMGLDPLVINRENRDKMEQFLPECGLIFTATGVETVTPEHVSPGTIIIDAGVRLISDPLFRKGRVCGDVNPDVYEMDDILYTPVAHGVGQLTTMLAFSNATEAASRYYLLPVTPGSISAGNNT